MTYIVETVGGILLAIANDVEQETVVKAENSLLLAWLAAAKKAGDGPVLSTEITKVLGNIGWDVATADSQNIKSALQDVPKNFMTLGVSEPAACQSLENTARTEGKVSTAWWGASSVGVEFVAVLSDKPETSLFLAGINAVTPDRRELLVGPLSDVSITASRNKLTLNTQVYDGVAAQIAEKIAPFRDKIVRP